MRSITAVLDACVLYSAPLRDFFLQLAHSGLFHARWTDRINDEWIGALLARRPDLKISQLERTRALMGAHVGDSLVEGYENLIEGLHLPDADDRHVLAAAIHCHADTIITFNISDFPQQNLDPHGIEIVHPDTFVTTLIERSPAAVCEVAKIHRARLRRPPKSVDEYLDTLARQNLMKTVELLRKSRELI